MRYGIWFGLQKEKHKIQFGYLLKVDVLIIAHHYLYQLLVFIGCTHGNS